MDIKLGALCPDSASAPNDLFGDERTPRRGQTEAEETRLLDERAGKAGKSSEVAKKREKDIESLGVREAAEWRQPGEGDVVELCIVFIDVIVVFDVVIRQLTAVDEPSHKNKIRSVCRPSGDWCTGAPVIDPITPSSSRGRVAGTGGGNAASSPCRWNRSQAS